ncbi:MAG: DUF389 domain-containing protein [Phenylobacterium sp.]|uniref:DUF389 domain-containing protein n=1 Tax=Phenylobacterium sp. TaxID=1871053 RepID=UPI00271565D8|nr:DUF389 domain-containing protein [Phenylobacterium sp.]MDO8900532.1 DUF389 domain-containing protein [Phenylobacterium sp.]
MLSAPASLRLRARFRLALAQLRRGLTHGAAPHTDADRLQIEAEIAEGARISPGYFALLFCSCGIAALGLLQSSAAVVIGAMLISPLMGPIMGMGMGVARLDARAFERAAVALALGAAVSVAASALIVWASPLKDVTPEILARTRPTLLDLVVAILSGFVGAYVLITKRPGVVAGVAIATALMPPLAVVGYGLATGAWNMAGGAFLLFLTNVVAILGAVFAVARRYGFQPIVRRRRRWEELALVATLLLLSLPLAVSLRDIVVEARETARVRSAIQGVFEGGDQHITDLQVRAGRGGVDQVRAVVVTGRFQAQAERRVAQALGGQPEVQIEQILTADGLPRADPSGGALANRALATSRTLRTTPEQKLRDMLTGVGTVEATQAMAAGRLQAAVRLNRPATLDDYAALEAAAQRFLPEVELELTPPFLELPVIAFGEGRSTLDAGAERRVALIAWAFTRWNVSGAEVVGSASPGPRGPRPRDVRVAEARAQAVADRLEALGVRDIEIRSETPAVSPQDPSVLWFAAVRPLGLPTARDTDAGLDEVAP